ncbi:MAG TPA: PAS domain-containing protein, partial [Chthoniobacterales bacterium]
MAALEIIHLEDNDLDAGSVAAQLRNSGIDARVVRVRTREAFRREVLRADLDLILADWKCRDCDGSSALSLAREHRPDVPFLLLADTQDYSDGVEFLKAGATDFISKRHLAQLTPAVLRALAEARDRTELVHAREGLAAQAELLDRATDSIIICEADGRITYWNRGAEKIYGWAKSDALGKNVHVLLQTRLHDEAIDLEKRLRADSHWEGELRQVTRDGRLICVLSRWALKGSEADGPRLQINTDISDRKKAEDALRASEERYRRFVEEDFTGNLMIRPDGTIVTCNAAFVRMFGFDSTDEALRANFMSLLRTRKEGADLLETVRRHGTVERHDLEMREPSGEAVYVVARLVGSFDPGGELKELQVYLFNDTKRKRLEEQLIQAQKMEGLGTLAGGIAHDFNNILGIILGYTTQLEKRGTEPERITTAINVIKEAVDRGAALVQQLLTSARQAEANLSAVDLNALLRELQRMLQATFPKT